MAFDIGGKRNLVAWRQLFSWAAPRLPVIVSALVYAATLHLAHATTLNPVYEFYGFTYHALDAKGFLFMTALVVLGAVSIPSSYSRPSSLVVVVLFVVIYVPTVVITIGLNEDWQSRHSLALAALGFGFSITCLGARREAARIDVAGSLPDSRFINALLILWAISGAALLYVYGPIMSFVGLDDIYTQRAAGASTNLFVGYLQVYFSNIFSIALIAAGLVRSRYSLIMWGAAGCLVMYMINAQRSVFLYPFAVVALYFVLTTKCTFMRQSTFAIAIASILVLASIGSYVFQVGGDELVQYFLFRILGIPSLTFSQYHDLFTELGYTWWSHVKGFSLFVPAPEAFQHDPLWPGLGYIVGERVYNEPINNHVANLFVGDGVAAAGPFGVLIISVLLSIWLALLDQAARGWNAIFVTLLVFPMANTLTNGHMFTMLLSFGGLFWLIVLHFYKPGRQKKPD